MTARPVLQRPPRDLRVDIMRGYMQLQIFASHAFGSFIGGRLIHACYGLSDGSEQFVLLAGLGVGSVFTLKASRQGGRGAVQDLFARIRRLYRNYLIVFFAFAALVMTVQLVCGWPDEFDRLGFSWLRDQPSLAVPGAFSTLFQPAFMGILPIFLWCMLVLPGFFWLLDRIGNWALLLPIGSYAGVQLFGWNAIALGNTGIAFDPFAWALLYMLGAWVGRTRLREGQAIPRHPLLIAGAIFMVAFGLWYRLVQYDWIAGPELTGWLDPHAITAKETLALPRLLHALSLAYLVGCFMPRESVWMLYRFPLALAAVGRNSLNVFCLGLFLSYLAATGYRQLPDAWWLDPLQIGAGVAVLLAWAAWLERRRPEMQRASAPPRPAA